ncbi:FG-GAP repeat domain-containing protein [Glycomyces artemisiae]|uniref:VCBS repeat protein n=1 Tax=Glycomyces artemisiae TaxID=1076443 RepID=A0A2T0UMS6_9ACTN|nr:VCBS repeat-containing protein [Glycomyces artemisiae]PRY59222.1 VCBS repeat protein [Glycomyces artemisiae]
MNAPPKRLRHAPSRTAALTAAALGAALLAAPGAAAAQETDCTALGGNPIVDGLEAALETAAACDVEVRISERSGPYETLYATPAGQLHVLRTTDATQDYQDRGPADPALIEADGTLVQADSPVAFAFSGTDTGAPLMTTRAGALDWTGDQPVPAVDGSTARYEDLADGVDLTVEADISTTRLAFTVDSAEAWSALATGLSFAAEASVREYRGSIYTPHVVEPWEPATWEQTTTFTARDAAGAAHAVPLTVDAGAIAFDLDQAILDGAAFPLTLTTEWTHHLYGVHEWGAATSASPDTALFRGGAGLDAPYFEAAGQNADAVAGPYCDALADPTCTTEHEAALYWNFWRPNLTGLTPAASPETFTYAIDSAVFSVDAADGTACTAPDLGYSSVYRPSTKWSDLPGPGSRAAVSGTCLNGTAVYELDPVSGLSTGVSTTFAMTPSDETARFDGESARLDVYYDIGGAFTLSRPTCAENPAFQDESAVAYGNFSTSIWRPDLIDPGLTWTATVRDLDSGQTVFSTAPAEVADGVNPSAAVTLGDGHYEVKHQFISGTTGYTNSSTCEVVVDTDAPDLIEVDVPDGPYYDWDLLQVEVTVSDAQFPNGVNEVEVICRWAQSCSPRTVTLTAGDTATFSLRIDENPTPLYISAIDKAGNRTDSEYFYLPVTAPSNDYDTDGRQDLLAVRKSDGNLMFYGGKGDGAFENPVSLGAGWGGLDVVMAGDLTGDRYPDLLVRDKRTGRMYTYPGDGDGGFGARILSGTGWNAMGSYTSATDFDGDGDNDVIALAEAEAKLYMYPGNGDGTFGSRRAVATTRLDEWSTLENLTTAGDLNQDRIPDLLARDGTVDQYLAFYSDGNGGFEQVRSNLNASLLVDSDDGARYDQVTGGGDYTGDGWADIYAVDSRTGELVLRSYDQNLFEVWEDRVVGTGWNTLDLPVAFSDRTYDFFGDGPSDVVARSAADGVLHHYWGNGTGGFERSGWFSDALGGMNLIEAGGDLTADGYPDVLARTSGGVLYVYPGLGQGSLDADARIRIGGGWGAMSAIVSGQDYNGDGKVDIIAREAATGNLWLYPGTGTGSHGSRVLIGTGWNSMSLITAVGDLDHDGTADVLARRNSDDCMYFYAGKPTGGVKNGVKIGCGWDVMNAVAAVGDFNGDGHVDWVARHANGNLYLYKGNGAGSYSASAVIGTGWGGMDVIA